MPRGKQAVRDGRDGRNRNGDRGAGATCAARFRSHDARTHMRVTTIRWGGDAGNTQYDPVSPHNFVDVQTCSPQSADPRMNPAALRLTCGCAISRSRFCRSREALRSVARLTRKPTITPSRQRARRSRRGRTPATKRLPVAWTQPAGSTSTFGGQRPRDGARARR